MQPIFNGRRKRLFGGLYVVEAMKDGVVEYWAQRFRKTQFQQSRNYWGQNGS